MKKAKKLLYSQKIAPYVFVVPFVLSLLIFWLYPLVSGISMSFQDVSFGGMKWVGLKHFKKLLGDKVFRIAVGNSLEYMVLTLLLMVPIPMLLAVLLESRLTKAKGEWTAERYHECTRKGVSAVAEIQVDRLVRTAASVRMALDRR